VIWPLGKYEVIRGLKVNQLVELAEKNALNDYNYLNTSIAPYLIADNKPAISFQHKEDEFIDFRVQFFMPGLLSTQGPRMAKADVNGDGLDDIFVGGASKQAGTLFLQNPDGSFKTSHQPSLLADSLAEDIDASFFDADGDRDMDLIIASGGYVFKENSPELKCRLYINDGGGNFTAKQNAVPDVYVNASCVKPADFDRDGDIDVFVGGRVIPGKYPEAPDSYLFMNDGKGNFTDQTTRLAAGLKKAGMITDAVWADINKDDHLDLIVVGEWMPLKVFINENGELSDKTEVYFSSSTHGWWSRIYAADFDKDGDQDFIAGNRGLNTQIKVSKEQPCAMYYRDFDNNGSIDGILSYFIDGKNYPALSRDEITEQLPILRKKFNDYESYSTATIDDLFPADELAKAQKLIADKMTTCYIENKGNGKFEITDLPIQAQFSPIYAINSLDVNKDGNLDLLLAGNFEKARVLIGQIDANHGMLFLGDSKGNFKYVTQQQSGLAVKGDVRDIQIVSNNKGKSTILLSRSDKPVVSYSLN
jgi:hypothetical protein